MGTLAQNVTRRRLRIAILAEERYLLQAQPQGMSTALQAEGHDVTLIDADAYEVADGKGLNAFDLIVVRGRSWSVLALLSLAEWCGKPVLNSRASIAAVHNKADMAIALADGKVRTPRTFVGRVESLSKCVPEACYPLILKPIFGDNASGLQIVDSSRSLHNLQWPDEAALAQQYLANDGYDIKLYGVGDALWVVRKNSPLNVSRKARASAELLPLTPEFESLGRRCARLFGLHLYGVDCILTPAGPVVIEVNEFPNYSGVPDADRTLARYAIQYAQRCAKEPS
jgi:ribosomal protein S6--L-glutamate ligase